MAAESASLLARYLAEVLENLSASDEEWLDHLLVCFPLPTIQEAPDLFFAVERVVHAVPWLGEVLSPEFTEPLARVAPAMRELAGRRGLACHPDAFQGEYLLAGSLIPDDHDLAQPRGVEALRAVLIACRWRWYGVEGAQYVTATERLASSIRGVARGRSKLEPRLLFNLGQGETLEEFIQAASGIRASSHGTLAEVWPHPIETTLLGIAKLRRQAKPVPPVPVDHVPGPVPDIPGEDGPPVAVPPKPNKGRAKKPNEDEVIERVLGGVRTGSSPRPKGAPEPIGGELPADVSPELTTAPQPRPPANRDEEAVQRYEAIQGIWSTNNLLLPNHPNVLPINEYARVAQELCGLLAEADLAPDLAYGACGLLVQALTGRTPKTLSSLEVLKDGREPHDPRWLDLLLAEGGLRMSVFWRVPREGHEPSYARPTTAQERYVEEVGGEIYLPLAPAFMEVLRPHAAVLRAFKKTPLAETEGWLRHAASFVSDRLGLRFTMGQLRSSVSTHLFESCRDMAAVQLLCADTVGHTVAGLSYYAPKKKTLAESHWLLQNTLLGGDIPMPKSRQLEGRTGAPLLARTAHAKALARAPAKSLHYGVSRLVEERRFAEIQLAMVNQVGGMLVATGTHRPGEALLALRRSDVWIDGDSGAALFQDKIHDAAHDPRLVALPLTLCRQMDAYLEHLGGLAHHLPSISEHVSRVLQGKAPLFFLISHEGEAIPLDYEGWKHGLPALWRVLPLNWGRHWMRTHALEHGVPPELVCTQMGHLEVAGYPFSRASPTEPWRFVHETAPGWEAVVRAQGWRVMRGVPAGPAFSLPDPAPLRLWERSVKEHETRQREIAKQWRVAMKSKLRDYEESATEWVLNHPVLIEAGIVARFSIKKQAQAPHGLSRTDFERIRDEAYESAGDDLALAIARANKLCSVAKVVNRRTGQSQETPGAVMHFRRPLDNAFVPGMMDAVRQIHVLRQHVSANLASAASDQWTDMGSACACAVLAMAAFGGCDHPIQIRGAIERRAQMQRSARLEDTILVPWGDAPHQVIALRGVPAIVLSRLAWKRGRDPMPEWIDVEVKLAELLPDWAIGIDEGASGVLDRLCETAAIANRYELSPAARRALRVSGGSTPAHIREQLAFVDGDPAGTVHRSWEEGVDALSPAPSQAKSAVRKGNARTQYLELCGAFPSPDRNVELPTTGEEVHSGEAASPEAYAKLIAEIRARMNDYSPKKRLHPIVGLLSGWVVDMLVRGTPRRENPALSTVSTYLTRIGGPLVYSFGQSSMIDIDDVELESAYLAAIEAKQRSRQKAAAAILSFHAFGLPQYGLPDIDLSEVKMYLGDDPDSLSDARLILPAEREVILAHGVVKLEAAKGVDSHHSVRVKHLASLAMTLYARGGLRRSEVMGVQFRDVSEKDGLLRVRVRPNMSRRLKTLRARRTVEVPLAEPVVESLGLMGWIEVERQRLPGQRLETAYVFTAVDAPFDATSRSEIVAECMEACRSVTGRSGARLHHLRHLVAMERTTPVFLAAADREALADYQRLAQVPTLQGDLALPRDLMGQVIALGHADPLTSLIAYHHVPWLLRSRTDAWHARRYLNRSVLAPLLGVTAHALDWAVKKRPGRNKGMAWLDVAMDPRNIPPAPTSAASLTARVERQGRKVPFAALSARMLGDLLDDVARVGSLEKTLTVRGGDPSQADLIRLNVSVLEGRMGRRLLKERVHAGVEGTPSRVLRRIESARDLDVLLEWYDSDAKRQRMLISRVAESACEFMQPGQGDRIHMPEAQARKLRRLLLVAGVEADRIAMAPVGAGVQSLRVQRIILDPEGNETGRRYIGLALKRILALVWLSQRISSAR